MYRARSRRSIINNDIGDIYTMQLNSVLQYIKAFNRGPRTVAGSDESRFRAK